jgi:branched-chain amino acid transport system permease protein
MRMVIFSVILIVLMIFARKGIMGREEFSWQWLFNFLRGVQGVKGSGDAAK